MGYKSFKKMVWKLLLENFEISFIFKLAIAALFFFTCLCTCNEQ